MPGRVEASASGPPVCSSALLGGSHFDPAVGDAFLQTERAFIDVAGATLQRLLKATIFFLKYLHFTIQYLTLVVN